MHTEQNTNKTEEKPHREKVCERFVNPSVFGNSVKWQREEVAVIRFVDKKEFTNNQGTNNV